MNRHEDPRQNMIQHIFGEKLELNTCLVFKIVSSWQVVGNIYYLHHSFLRVLLNSSINNKRGQKTDSMFELHIPMPRLRPNRDVNVIIFTAKEIRMSTLVGVQYT